jgi:leucyl/phenylalanyl-tRNA--protein transferase
MPVFKLNRDIVFPDPELSEPDGLLAVGGDLSSERLLEAYRVGIFPWYSEGEPILWWSPNPRMVLFPDRFLKHKNLAKTVRSNKFQVSFDTMFEQVIEFCSSVSRDGHFGDTWITEEMKLAYTKLHKIGAAHSVEVSYQNNLVGGLYGVSIGGCFFGESMFHTVSDASKVALWYLVERVKEWDFDMIDVQQETEHLKSLGAVSIDRKEFLHLLTYSVTKNGKIGSWNL